MTPAPAPAPLVTSSTDKYLLLATTIFFALVLIGIDKLFPNEGQVFQVIANLTSGFAGAFFHALSPSSNGSKSPAPVIPISSSAPAVPDQAAAALAAATAAAPPPTPVKLP